MSPFTPQHDQVMTMAGTNNGFMSLLRNHSLERGPSIPIMVRGMMCKPSWMSTTKTTTKGTTNTTTTTHPPKEGQEDDNQDLEDNIISFEVKSNEDSQNKRKEIYNNDKTEKYDNGIVDDNNNNNNSNNKCLWKSIPIGAERIVRGIAAERILHELLDIVNATQEVTVQQQVICNIVCEFPETCQKKFEFRWEDGSTRQLLPLAVLCCLDPTLTTIQTVYEAYPNAISVREPYKKALPFHLATAFEASLDVVQYLYSKNKLAIQTERLDGVYPIHLACGFYRGDASVLNFLLEEYPESASKVCTIIEWSPMHSACHGGVTDLEFLQKLHALDPTMIHKGDKHGRTPLHLACRSRKGNPQMIQFLVQNAPTTIHVRDALDGWTPLFLACLHQSPPVIEALLDCMDDANVRRMVDTGTGCTILHWAAMGNTPDAVQVLAQRFPDLLLVQTQDTTRETPLCRAVAMRAPMETIRILIQYGPQAMWMENSAGLRPLQLAMNLHQPMSPLRALAFRIQHNSYYVNNNNNNDNNSDNNNNNRNQNHKEVIEFLKYSERQYRKKKDRKLKTSHYY